MPNPVHFLSAIEILTAIGTSQAPADSQMDQYFRSHPKLGARDRGEVAELVYHCLRQRRSLAWVATGRDIDRPRAEDLVAAAVVQRSGWSARALDAAGYSGDASGIFGRVEGGSLLDAPKPVQIDLPDWLYEKLAGQYGGPESREIGAACRGPATLDLRVNTLRCTREGAADCLAAEEFPMEPTPYSPVGLRRNDRAPIFRTRCFADGMVEVQDEGSQLLSLLVEPRRGEMVADFCAGAGGKTLHLGAQLANSGSLYAFDVSAKRLDRLKPRASRAGLHNIRSVVIRNENDPRIKRLGGKFDRVLVDAPCSGTGTLRRSPDIKWRTIDLDALGAAQRSILAAASTLVKPGGRLVYATCSLLREENEHVIADFMNAHREFEPLPVNEILSRRHVPLTMPDSYLRLLPHRHHTDGFFAAVVVRST